MSAAEDAADQVRQPNSGYSCALTLCMTYICICMRNISHYALLKAVSAYFCALVTHISLNNKTLLYVPIEILHYSRLKKKCMFVH